MRKVLLWTTVAVILAVGAVSCLATVPVEPAPVEFATIAEGAYSAVNQSSSMVIKDQETWETTWVNLIDHLPPENDPGYLQARIPPEIDWGDYMLLAHFMGQKSTNGYEVKFTEVLAGDKISATVKEISPGSNCTLLQVITLPYQVIQIPRTDKQVEFIVQQEIGPCPPVTWSWTDWPTFHGDSHRAGCGYGRITTNSTNLIWNYTLQSPALSGVPSSPVVGKNGIVYAGSMGAPGYLYAINASSGSLIWQSATTAFGSISTAPAISPDGKRIYVCTLESNGINPNILAYDAATGAKLWTGMSNDGLKLPGNDFVSSSNPVAVNISGTTVIFVCGSVEYGGYSGFPGRYRLYQIEDQGASATCTYYEVGPLPSVPLYGKVSPSPAVADDYTVYTTTAYDSSVSMNGSLYAVDGTNPTMTLKWRLPLATTSVESVGLPCVREDGGLEVIYCGTTDWTMWKVKEDLGETSAQKICYYRSAANTLPITCPAIVDLDADGNLEIVFTAPSAAGTYVYAIHDDCTLYWSTSLPGILGSSPALGWTPVSPPYGWRVFLGGGYPTGGTIYTLNGWDGAISGAFITGGAMASSPAVCGGNPLFMLGHPGWVFATSNDGSFNGKLYAFGLVP